jgi:demethylmenaquinone methyltransferase/2-methoxy-6-polyprenyl-1,4-benzoquinol methylase
MPTNDVATALAAAAPDDRATKRRFVHDMFGAIAPRYDLLNHLLSLSIDRYWRRRAIEELRWQRAPHGRYLDLCAGTLDVALGLARRAGFAGRVIGADFAEPMLRVGRQKMSAEPVSPVVADALQLPLAPASAEGAIVAFGIRNVNDLDAALREVFRVLSSGARFVILEFTTPRNTVVRAIYHSYFRHVVPLIGGLVSGHRGAYRYLPASVAQFPGEAELAERMRAAGFRDVGWLSLTLGVAAIHVGAKP